MRVVSKMALACAAALTASAAYADRLDAVPTAWKLQSYAGVSTVLWYTGSPCQNGKLTLPTTDSPDRNKLLWATVLEAKAANLPMSIEYTVSGTTCTITSFAVSPQS